MIYELIEVGEMGIRESSKLFDTFYEDWSFTMEGLSTESESINAFMEWLEPYLKKPYRDVKKCIPMYVISGSHMNWKYQLTGDNRYKRDLSIVVIKSDVFNSRTYNRFCIDRFTVGGRWFTDVVDNNLWREAEKEE